MQNLNRPALLLIFTLFLAACQRQPSPLATPSADPDTASPEGTTLPTTTPSPAQPTNAPTLVHTPAAQATATVATATVATATVTPTPRPSPTSTPATLPVTEEMSFKLLAQEGGIVHSVAVAGNRVYVGAGPRVLALDVANPGAPQLIARSEPPISPSTTVCSLSPIMGSGSWPST